MKSSERRDAWAAVDDIRQWIAMAEEIRFLAGHLPITGSTVLDPQTLAALRVLFQIQASGVVDSVSSESAIPWFGMRGRREPVEQASLRLRTFHWGFGQAGMPEAMWRLRSAL